MPRGRPRKNRDADGQEQSQEATRLANTGERADIIRSAIRYIEDRESEIRSIREDINEYKSKYVKGDLGFKLSDFNAIMRVAKLERDDRDTFIDTLREGFEALGIGGVVDWVAAAEAEQPRQEAPAEEPADAA